MNAEAKIASPGIPGERDPRPIVALPRSGLPGLAIFGIALVLAVLLFLVLNGRREAGEATSLRPDGGQGATIAPPPPLAIPYQQQQAELPTVALVATPAPPVMLRPSRPAVPMPAPQWPAMPAPAPEPEPFIQVPTTFEEAAPQPPAASFGEPALVMDAGGLAGGAGPGAEGEAAAPPNQTGEEPRGGAAEGPSPRVGKIGNPATVMPVGTLIQAVLETPIDTSKPGLARAIVSKDARGFNGQQVLVPRGSRLAGEYRSDSRSGGNRVLINWTQLIRPDGAVIRLDSPAADSLGGAGVPGRRSGLSVGRFAQGLLRTAMAVGTGLAPWSNQGAVIVGLPGTQLTNVVGQAGGSGRQRRIRVRQGTAFNVFVARNLDFSAATPSQ